MSSQGGAACLLGVDECWRLFRQILPAFPWRYAAYADLRRRGWVPRSGCQYGADFLLYWPEPPPQAGAGDGGDGGHGGSSHGGHGGGGRRAHGHAVSCVHVRAVERGAPLLPSWADLQLASRLGAEVSKRVELCLVTLPRGSWTTLAGPVDTEGCGEPAGLAGSGRIDLRWFSCVEDMVVHHITVARWSPKADRQKPAQPLQPPPPPLPLLLPGADTVAAAVEAAINHGFSASDHGSNDVQASGVIGGVSGGHMVAASCRGGGTT